MKAQCEELQVSSSVALQESSNRLASVSQQLAREGRVEALERSTDPTCPCK